MNAVPDVQQNGLLVLAGENEPLLVPSNPVCKFGTEDSFHQPQITVSTSGQEKKVLSRLLEAVGETEYVLNNTGGSTVMLQHLQEIAIKWSQVIENQRSRQVSSKDFCHLSKYHDEIDASLTSDCALLEMEAILLLATVSTKPPLTGVVVEGDDCTSIELEGLEGSTKMLKDELEVVSHEYSTKSRTAASNKSGGSHALVARNKNTKEMLALLSVMSRVIGRLKAKSRSARRRRQAEKRPRKRSSFKPRGPLPKQTTRCVWDWRKATKAIAKQR